MKNVIITPSPLHGTVTPPPSKSALHRAIICAALANGSSVLSPYVSSDDIDATIDVMHALGAYIRAESNILYINGENTLKVKYSALNCRESGSTLRFLIPIAAAGGGRYTFQGQGRLPARPIGPYLDCLPGAGVTCETAGGLPLTITGRLQSGDFSLPGNVSPQFVTGLLLALPLLSGDSRIILTSPLESKGYIDLTIGIMRHFGVDTVETEKGYFVKGGQKYTNCNTKVEGDWSQAAFWLAAGALAQPVACAGLDTDSKQGDREISGILTRFGAIIENGDNVRARSALLRGAQIDASQIPDLVPILAVLACFAKGKTIISNAGRLRIKESDRLHTIALGLNALGGRVTELDEGLEIEGGPMTGGEANGASDHRIVMALSIAAAYCSSKTVIHGCECINKSYPEFFRDFIKLGGIANVINVG